MKVADEDVQWLQRRLLAWYDRNRRTLPWRGTSDPYRVWVSEIMLCQTQVARVAEYYDRFLQAFPTVEDLARATLERVLAQWEGLGYYSRARSMHEAAREVVGTRGGRFPETVAELRALPGVGPYTAAAIASIAFGEPVPALDTHGIRIVARLGAIAGDVRGRDGHRAVDALARRLLAPHRPGDFNQALMDLGSMVCTPVTPACDRCPLETRCAAARRGGPERWPRRAPAAAKPSVTAACGLIERDGRFLLVRRPERGLLGGLWEFPGGRAAQDELPADACARGVREKTGVRVRGLDPVDVIRHWFTHFRVDLHVFRCAKISGRASGDAVRWCGMAEMRTLAMTRTARKIVDALAAGERRRPRGVTGRARRRRAV